MPKSSKRKAPGKPKKPYDGFPLYAHATRRWAKKIRGKLVYFGSWDDPDGALQKYLDQKDDLHAGRTPRAPRDGLTVRDLANRFLTVKREMVGTGELREETWRDYYAVCEHIIRVFGPSRLVVDLAADDFARLRSDRAKGTAPKTLANFITRARPIFKFAFDNGVIDRPVHYGTSFNKPSARIMRKARAAAGPRLFSAEQIRQMIDTAEQPLKAMILLAINCGFGNADCGNLPKRAVDLAGGWVDFPRPKTGAPRRCSLWPETVAAVREAINTRPTPVDAEAGRLAFLTPTGNPWAKETSDTPITKQMQRLLQDLNLYAKGRGFYDLRRTFRTVADESNDQPAIDHIMGHAPAAGDMSAVYRQRISDERLKAVTDYVHRWLFGSDPVARNPAESDGNDADTSVAED